MRVIIGTVWIVFILYAFLFAPGVNISEDAVFWELMRFQSREPYVLMMFSLLGIWPVVFTCLLLRNDNRSVPAWPFVVGSFALGAFSLLPYFALRNTKQIRHNRISPRLVHTVSSPALYIILTLLTITTMLFGVINGSIANYTAIFVTSHFVHIMTIDFFILTLLSIYVLYEEIKETKPASRLYNAAAVPILGPLFYLLWKQRN